jgi:peptidoglycan/LPS O-acetylase OafA/YrhL
MATQVGDLPYLMKVSHAYWPALDVLRGISITLVLLAHTPGAALGAIRPLGAMGVHVFFALSGFLITYRFVEEYEQTGRIDLRAFYRRRARRILPPAVIYLAVLGVLGPVLHLLPASVKEIAASLFFYRNLYLAPMPDGWYTGHFWSLSLEEQFYLTWPVMLAALGVVSRRARVAAISLVVAAAVWRAHVFQVNPSANIYRPDLLADHLLWGCLIALSWKQVLSIPVRIRMGIGFMGMAGATVVLFEQPPLWQPVFALCVAVGFILAAEATGSWTEGWKPLRKLGEASYDCYIWQSLFLAMPFASTGLPFAQRLPWSYFFLAVATAGSFLLTFPKRAARGPATI